MNSQNIPTDLKGPKVKYHCPMSLKGFRNTLIISPRKGVTSILIAYRLLLISYLLLLNSYSLIVDCTLRGAELVAGSTQINALYLGWERELDFSLSITRDYVVSVSSECLENAVLFHCGTP